MKTPNMLLMALALTASGAIFAQQSAPAAEHPMYQRMADRMKAADTNNDGLISKSEAAAIRPLNEHFDLIDTNKDGFLSQDEIKAMHDKMHREHGGPRGHGAFGGIDANHDRVITRDEMVQHQQKMLQDFDAADSNKDGKLSADEMKAFHEKMRAQRPPRGDAPPPAPAK
jgi:Ca2+-binding EF-hand superfamily protein